jgi:hypothetical protein
MVHLFINTNIGHLKELQVDTGVFTISNCCICLENLFQNLNITKEQGFEKRMLYP